MGCHFLSNCSTLAGCLSLLLRVYVCVHVTGTYRPEWYARGAVIAITEPTQTSSASCHEDSEVSAHVASEQRVNGTAMPLYPHARGPMWLPPCVRFLCTLTTRVGNKRALVHTRLSFWVGADTVDTQTGVKREIEGYDCLCKRLMFAHKAN